MKKALLWTGLTAIVGIAAAAVLWQTGHLDLEALAGKANAQQQSANAYTFEPPAVTVVRPRLQDFVQRLRLNGSIVAREEILIAPQIEGQRVRAVNVDAGAYVKKGDVIALLATENLDALVAQNDAALKRADAGIAQAKNAIAQAEARLTENAASLERAKPLRRSGYLSQSILEQRQANTTSARAALAIAKDGLRLAQSEKEQAKAKHRELLWRQSRSEITAPEAGLIVSRFAKVGAIATGQGEPMFRLIKAGEIELEGEVTNEQLQRLQVGHSARIEVDGLSDIAATVRLISPRIDPATRLGTVRLFIGRNDKLRIGAFAVATIETGQSNGLGIPATAIMRDDEGAYVQVIDAANKVAVRRIVLGLTEGGTSEVVQGLSEEDRVIAKAGTFLGPGELIKPIEQATEPETATPPKAG